MPEKRGRGVERTPEEELAWALHDAKERLEVLVQIGQRLHKYVEGEMPAYMDATEEANTYVEDYVYRLYHGDSGDPGAEFWWLRFDLNKVRKTFERRMQRELTEIDHVYNNAKQRFDQYNADNMNTLLDPRAVMQGITQLRGEAIQKVMGYKTHVEAVIANALARARNYKAAYDRNRITNMDDTEWLRTEVAPGLHFNDAIRIRNVMQRGDVLDQDALAHAILEGVVPPNMPKDIPDEEGGGQEEEADADLASEGSSTADDTVLESE